MADVRPAADFKLPVVRMSGLPCYVLDDVPHHGAGVGQARPRRKPTVPTGSCQRAPPRWGHRDADPSFDGKRPEVMHGQWRPRSSRRTCRTVCPAWALCAVSACRRWGFADLQRHRRPAHREQPCSKRGRFYAFGDAFCDDHALELPVAPSQTLMRATEIDDEEAAIDVRAGTTRPFSPMCGTRPPARHQYFVGGMRRDHARGYLVAATTRSRSSARTACMERFASRRVAHADRQGGNLGAGG